MASVANSGITSSDSASTQVNTENNDGSKGEQRNLETPDIDVCNETSIDDLVIPEQSI